MTGEDALRAAQLVGVVRDADGGRAAAIAEGLARGGLRAVEITAPTPDAFTSVAALGERFPATVWGVGTVRTLGQVERAEAAGARFIVSPHGDPELIRAALDRGLVPIPGAMTPTEILRARDAGAPFVKVFPVSCVGGPRFVRAVRGPLPDVPLWVSGDVALDEIAAYRDAGATLVGLTSALTRGLVGDPGAAAEVRAQAALAALEASAQPALELRGATALTLRRSDILAATEPAPLHDWLPSRPGRVFRLAPLLSRAGFRDEDAVVARSEDGFETELSAATLRTGGAVQVDDGEHPLTPKEGGPFRLYVRGTGDRCDNVKRLVSLERVDR